MLDSTEPRAVASHNLNLPNLLTIGRVAAVPALVFCLYAIEGDTGRLAAFAIFVVASITDWLDGYLARAWQQQSVLGAMLDPIADKLLVGASLMILVYDRTIDGVAIFAALVILCREILVSGLREFLAGLSVKVMVTELAKWKTGIQMLALGVLIVGPAVDTTLPWIMPVGLALLWASAGLTIWTGSNYLTAALDHAARAEQDLRRRSD